MCCPACLNSVPWNRVRFNQKFECDVCKQVLRVSRYYSLGVVAPSLILLISVLYLLGARGTSLLLLVLAGFFPWMCVCNLIVRRFLPPKIDFDDSYSLRFNGSGNIRGKS
jgi:hypothetical protein